MSFSRFIKYKDLYIMSFSRFIKYKDLYITLLPLMTAYPTIVGIDIGCTENKRKPDGRSIINYSNIIGYTSLGVLTGITYPISYPLFGCYFLYSIKK